MTPKDFLTNKNFCPMPWTGLMYNLDGKVKNCIRSAGSIGNLKDNTIQEILHGSDNVDTQTNMLNNRPGKNCHTCYDLERDKSGLDIISDRVFYLRELKQVPLDVYQIGKHELHTIDVRWTNLCNFSCVYCNADFSSRWADELGVKMVRPGQHQIEEFKRYIIDHVDKLKHVYLAGGEPLLMKENLELLDLLKQTNPNVQLRINTNLSKTDTRIFDKLSEFGNVHWTVSVETLQDEFEYIRFGGRWQDFLDNLHVIKQLDHKISFNMLWFVLNYNSIFDCVDFLKSLGFHNNSFIIGALLSPEYLNIRHLPDHVLKLLEQTLEAKINERPGYLLEDSYQNMLAYIRQPFDKNLQDTFQRLNTLDKRRNLDSSKIFTELYKLREEN